MIVSVTIYNTKIKYNCTNKTIFNKIYIQDTFNYFFLIMSEDLFASLLPKTAPLAARLRPRRREDFSGQQALIKKLGRGLLHSMLLYGPPGCGKTTLATILAEEAGLPLFHLSAISAGVKEVRQIIERGEQDRLNKGRGVILFLDEIHRFSRPQQDSLLQAVESGVILLIGATTENPSFSIDSALLSRLELYRMNPLKKEELQSILQRALKEDHLLRGCSLEQDAEEILLEAAGGDGRRLLSILELAFQGKGLKAGAVVAIDRGTIEAVVEGGVRYYNRMGEQRYNYISAFIKSIRGSDPDAALLYLSCMLDGGEDPLYIARRLVILAAEDVGNACPQALSLATSALLAVERIGLPEGRIVLAQAALFLAATPKSNAAYSAIERALKFTKGRQIIVPNHLRNAPTATHRSEGAGKGYLYPHDFQGHFVGQNYFPTGLDVPRFYFPTSQGDEASLKKHLKTLWPDKKYE